MTKAEREAAAVAGHKCPRYRCWAEPGNPCRYLRGIYTYWGARTFKHPHAERMALVTEESA